MGLLSGCCFNLSMNSCRRSGDTVLGSRLVSPGGGVRSDWISELETSVIVLSGLLIVLQRLESNGVWSVPVACRRVSAVSGFKLCGSDYRQAAMMSSVSASSLYSALR